MIKEMKYQVQRMISVLDKGIKNGFPWFVLSQGTHPTAYISLPKGHKYYGKGYDEIPIDVHGGLTYADSDFYFNPIVIKNLWFIGWDYAHAGDFLGYELEEGIKALRKKYNSKGEPDKKWTTKELREEVFDAIKQLSKQEAVTK